MCDCASRKHNVRHISCDVRMDSSSRCIGNVWDAEFVGSINFEKSEWKQSIQRYTRTELWQLTTCAKVIALKDSQELTWTRNMHKKLFCTEQNAAPFGESFAYQKLPHNFGDVHRCKFLTQVSCTSFLRVCHPISMLKSKTLTLNHVEAIHWHKYKWHDRLPDFCQLFKTSQVPWLTNSKLYMVHWKQVLRIEENIASGLSHEWI